jgi:Lon protease-like protein
MSRRRARRKARAASGYPRPVARPPGEIPLFPLASVVLFPKVRAPLHVFEPRYRQMMEAALAGARLIGMASVPPEHQAAMAGDPPLFEVGCAGFVEVHERLADGRFNLILLGTERFRILRERPRERGRLYRIAEVAWLRDAAPEPGEDAELRALREQILGALRQLLARAGASAADLEGERLAALDHETFANSLSQRVGLPPEEKQGLLEADGVRRRLDTLDGILQFHLARARLPGGRSEALH